MTIEQNFQPQVGDTSNGAHVHTYIPRADGSILFNGIAYFPKDHMQPTVSGNATQIPVVVKPGQEAEIMTGAPVPQHVQTVPQFFHPQAYFGHYPIQQINYAYHASAEFPFWNSAFFTAPIAPLVYPQPYGLPHYPQPTYMPYQNFAVPQQISYAPNHYPIISAANQSVYGAAIQQPNFGQWGLTQGEKSHEQLLTSVGTEMNDKQEMKPANDDPFKDYWVRELDGSWTMRNRMTIDSGDIGKCRWYATDGVFYAVRLPNA